MKKHILLSAAAVTAFATLASGQSAVPETMNYQAVVTDSSGNLIGVDAPVNREVEFRIYDVSSGGSPLWAEKQTVTIYEGNISTQLGLGTSFDGLPRPELSTVFDGSQRFLGIKLDTAANEFSPRQQIVANPYAFTAKVAENALDADTADTVDASSELVLNWNDVLFGASTDTGYALRAGNPLTFAATNIDGPVLVGNTGGALGTSSGGEALALQWNSSGDLTASNNVTVSNDLTVNGNLVVPGGIDAQYLNLSAGSLDIGDNALNASSFSGPDIYANFIHLEDSALAGLNVNADTQINGNFLVSGSIGNATSSAPVSFSGDVSIGNNSLVVERISSPANYISLDSRLSVPDEIAIDGIIRNPNTHGYDGAVLIDDSFRVADDAWFSRDMDISGNLQVDGSLSGIFGGAVVFDGDVELEGKEIKFYTSTNNFCYIRYDWRDDQIEIGSPRASTFSNNSNNQASYDGDNNWDFESDARLKENIRDEEPVLDRLLQVKLRRYNFIGSDKEQVGVVAQELQPLFPDMIGENTHEESGEVYLTVGYSDFGMLAVRGIQELKAEQDEEREFLHQRVDELEAENAFLRERLAAIESRLDAAGL